jgi:hypothetical protein
LNRADCFRQANGDAQEASHIERLSFAPIKNQIQGLTSRVFEYEDRPRCTLEFQLQRISAARSIRRGSLHGFCRISSFSRPISALFEQVCHPFCASVCPGRVRCKAQR